MVVWPRTLRCLDCGSKTDRHCSRKAKHSDYSPTCNIYLCGRCDIAYRLVERDPKRGSWTYRISKHPGG